MQQLDQLKYYECMATIEEPQTFSKIIDLVLKWNKLNSKNVETFLHQIARKHPQTNSARKALQAD